MAPRKAAADIRISTSLVEQMFEHARRTAPDECCGLLGGRGSQAASVYPLSNVASDARVAYEASPEELFAAQREMRARGEQLLAIYHSHPCSEDPVPSESDVRLAFYPSAVYLIIGFGADGRAVLRGFLIPEGEGGWERAEVETHG